MENDKTQLMKLIIYLPTFIREMKKHTQNELRKSIVNLINETQSLKFKKKKTLFIVEN